MATPSAVPETLNDDALGLSAAARESFGFADDQFMELSTSGASIYSLRNILSEQSSASSGRLAQSSGGSSNSSFRRALLGTPGKATQDESSLPRSGMSLAYLGSLSRSVRRLPNTVSNEETIGDPDDWREPGGDARGSPERGAGVQELSGPIAELRRQQSFSRRCSTMTAARGEALPPPLPVGVNAAPLHFPTEEQTGALQHDTSHAQDNYVSTSGGPRSLSDTQVPAGGPGWGGVLQDSITIAAGSGDDLIGSSNGSRGGDANGATSRRSPETKPRKKGSRPVRALLRTMGLRGAARQDGGVARHLTASDLASGEVERLSLNSWSPDSSSREGAHSNTSSVNTGVGCSPVTHRGGRALRTRSAPSSDHASEVVGPTSDTEVASKSEGLRGRIAQAFSHRRKSNRTSRKGVQSRGQGTMSNTPSEADGGQRGLIPPDPRLGDAPQPGVYPEWYRSRSAPVGPTDSELKMDAIPDLLARAFPGTPLGASNRSFDANQALLPSTYDADESNSSLPMPPQLGTHAAKEVLGASFDPNLSVKSLFDTSYTADGAPREVEVPASPWSDQRQEQLQAQITQQQRQQQQRRDRQQQAGTLSRMGPGIPSVPLPTTSGSPSRIHPNVSTTTGATREMGSDESGTIATSSDLVRRDSLVRTAAVLLDQDQLANDLSDLSVSAESHRRGDDQAQGVDTASGMHGAPSLKASGLAGSVGLPWLPDAPAIGQGDDERHQPGSWLHGRDEIDPTAGGGILPLADVQASSEDRKVINDGMWPLPSQDTVNPAGHGAGLVSDSSWAVESETSIPAHGDSPAAVGLLAGELEGFPELGPVPANAPLSGNVGRAQSADLDLLRRRSVSHLARGKFGGKGQAAQLRGRSAPRHTSLELGKASSPIMSTNRSSAGLLHGVSSESAELPPKASTSTSSAPIGSNGSSVTNVSSPGGSMIWATDAPFRAFEQQDQTALPPPATTTAPAASTRTGSAPPTVRVPHSSVGTSVPSANKRTPTPWWTSRDSSPARLSNGSSRNAVLGDSTMNRPTSLPGGGTTLQSGSDTSVSSLRSTSLPKPARGETKHDLSWSALQAMIPTPGMGSKKGSPSGDGGAGMSSGESDTGRVGSSGAGERTDIVSDGASTGGMAGSDQGEDALDSSTTGGLRMLGSLGRRKLGTKSQGPRQEAPNPELMSKRRLNPSRVLEMFGKHKKQCLDGTDAANESHLSGHAFHYLREQLALPPVEPAVAKPSSSTPGKASTVSDTSKANRQAVAARRPRNRGRFMKSQQKWVTQVELKQEKIKNAAAASVGTSASASAGVASARTGAASLEPMASEDACGRTGADNVAKAATVAAAGRGGGDRGGS